MRNKLIAALAVAAIPLTAHAATVFVVSGGGALAEFSQTSVDGCVTTTGQLVVVEGHAGEDKEDGVYAVAVQYDQCLDVGDGFAGYAPLDFDVDGLSSASASGTLVMPSYAGSGAELTLDLDLAWSGTGAVFRQGGRFHDENVVEFTWSRGRAASTTGTLDLDGEPASIDAALLIAGTSGTIFKN